MAARIGCVAATDAIELSYHQPGLSSRMQTTSRTRDLDIAIVRMSAVADDATQAISIQVVFELPESVARKIRTYGVVRIM